MTCIASPFFTEALEAICVTLRCSVLLLTKRETNLLYNSSRARRTVINSEMGGGRSHLQYERAGLASNPRRACAARVNVRPRPPAPPRPPQRADQAVRGACAGRHAHAQTSTTCDGVNRRTVASDCMRSSPRVCTLVLLCVLIIQKSKEKRLVGMQN